MLGIIQQQPLRRRERGGKRPACNEPWMAPARASFALHLDHRRHRCPNVGLSLRGTPGPPHSPIWTMARMG